MEVDFLAFLSATKQNASKAYFANVANAVGIIKSFGDVKSDDLLFLHTTVMYLCCYSASQYAESVFPAIDNTAWSPFNVTFAAAVCNYDNSTNRPNATTTSIILLLSPESQHAMGKLVDQFEASIRARGLHVAPRSGMEMFHSTLAVVPKGYPVDQALQAINSKITDWTSGNGPITIDQFESILPPHIVHATTTGQ